MLRLPSLWLPVDTTAGSDGTDEQWLTCAIVQNDRVAILQPTLHPSE